MDLGLFSDAEPSSVRDSVVLTQEQEQAVQACLGSLLQGEIASLAGAAGTGKTTCMRTLGDRWRNEMGESVVQIAPTGKAASVLRDATGRPATTVHALLYQAPDEDKGGGLLWERKMEPICSPGTLIICDEGSMVGTQLYRDLTTAAREADARILFVGDREQLSPVNDSWGVDWSEPTAVLDTVHRQAEGSPVIRLATWIRKNGDLPPRVPDTGAVQLHRNATPKDPALWLQDHRAGGSDATLLCYTNKTRRTYNEVVRFARGLVPIDEAEARIVEGDRILVCFNNHAVGAMNGEVIAADHVKEQAYGPFGQVVYEVKDRTRTAPLSFPKLFFTGAVREFQDMRRGATRSRDEQALSWVLGDYGECLTIHKSQGSSWDHVGIVWDGGLWGLRRRSKAEFRRLLYTAVTRARRTVTLWMLPSSKGNRRRRRG